MYTAQAIPCASPCAGPLRDFWFQCVFFVCVVQTVISEGLIRIDPWWCYLGGCEEQFFFHLPTPPTGELGTDGHEQLAKAKPRQWRRGRCRSVLGQRQTKLMALVQTSRVPTKRSVSFLSRPQYPLLRLRPLPFSYMSLNVLKCL